MERCITIATRQDPTKTGITKFTPSDAGYIKRHKMNDINWLLSWLIVEQQTQNHSDY